MTQNQNGPVRRVPPQRSAYRADMPSRMWSWIRSVLEGVPKDAWRMAAVGLAVIALAGFPHFDADKVLRYVDIIKALPGSFDWED